MRKAMRVALFAIATSLSMMSAPSMVNAAGRQDAAEPLTWSINYGRAMDAAEAQGKMMFVYFYDASAVADPGQLTFERQVLADPKIRRLLRNYVLLLLPLDAKIYVEGKPIKVLQHEAFIHMRRLPGAAIIDLASRGKPYFRQVVSAFPFEQGHYFDASQLRTILQLPPGTLTQRTLVYAVRTYPDHPLSASGKQSPILTNFAEQHSQYMADVEVQGHQNWETRFHQLEAIIPAGLEPQEVAAESWPGQPLVDAAVECVYSWRRSEGHWEAVRGRHPIFGFDMKLGRNGIWYATGIFGRRR